MTDLRIEEQIREDAEALEQDWDTNPRWHGIERHYSAEDVIKLRGSFRVEHSVARAGAERLWDLLARGGLRGRAGRAHRQPGRRSR